MSLAIINIHQRQQDELAHVGTTALLARRHVIKKKVIAIGRLSRQLAVLRAHTELVKKLKRMSDNGKLPLGALSLGEQGLLQGMSFGEKVIKSSPFKSFCL